jgi:hypothetical protein
MSLHPPLDPIDSPPVQYNAWVRGLPLHYRVLVFVASFLFILLVVKDPSAVFAFDLWGLVILVCAAAAIILAPFWIGYDATMWIINCCRCCRRRAQV